LRLSAKKLADPAGWFMSSGSIFGSPGSPQPRPAMMVTAEKILELAKQAETLQIAEFGRTAPIARNGAIELHVRSRKSLCHLR